MSEAIEFPYRGFVVKITPESDGWAAHVQHPCMVAGQFCSVARNFLTAIDAVQAAMSWVNLCAFDLAMRELLQAQRQSDRLSLTEFNHLACSYRRYWRSHLPVRGYEG